MTERDRPQVVLPTSSDFDRLLEVLSQLSARRGLVDREVVPRVAELKACVVAIEELAHGSPSDAAARERAATAIDQLIDTVQKLQAMCERIARRAGTELRILRDVDVTRWTTALRHFAQLLRESMPAEIDEGALTRVLDQVRAITGVVDPLTDPWADPSTARQLKADITADVNKSLDDIFGDFSDLDTLT